LQGERVLKKRTILIGFTWLLVLAWGGLLPNLAFGAKRIIVSTNICQLYLDRQAPQLQTVRIHATAWVALRHGGALLQDSSCPKVAIGFGFADGATARPKVAKLDHAMTGDVMDLTPRIFDVKMIGVFLRPSVAEPNGSFRVDNVEWFEQRK
jgi:hypothetical protein